MKLWKKLSLTCSGILIFIVIICSVLLLVQSKNSILESTYEHARDKQHNLASSFSEMAAYYIDENDSAATRDTLVEYCFSRFADSAAVLLHDGKEIYSDVSIDPSAYLPSVDYEQRQYTGVIGGRNILIVGSMVTILDNTYPVYVVMDISTVYNGITMTAWRFAIIGLMSILIGTGLIIWLVRLAIKPLMGLRESSKHIAAGNYTERAAIETRDEIGELAEDFNAMAAAVEQHVDDLTETMLRQRLFIGGVTHEFKTPLTTMILNADTLQNTYLSEDEREQAISYIEKQCKWLERLTQKLLKLITLHEDIEKKRTSVPVLLTRVKESLTEILRQRKTPLTIDCETQTLAMDIDLMQSALINLIDNASKASKPGQIITVKAYENTIEVQDRGYGIPESELIRITEPFYMVDKSRSKKHGGSGLGLALVKEIVAAHGAVLAFESIEGEGTHVCIKF